jgi:hypothetical protein
VKGLKEMLGVRLLMKGLGVRMKSPVVRMMKISSQLINKEKGNIIDYGNKGIDFVKPKHMQKNSFDKLQKIRHLQTTSNHSLSS